MPYCSKCGSFMKDGDKFCARCGTPFNTNISPLKQQNLDNLSPNDLNNKSLSELKSLARSGNVDAAFLVGKHYASEEKNIVKADEWFDLTYTGETIHVSGLILSFLSKKVLFSTEVELSNGFSGYSVDTFHKNINKYTGSAKTIIRLWQQNNRTFEEKYYNDAMAFLSSINLYLGRVLMRQTDVDSLRNARNCFYSCINSRFLEPTKKFISNMGYSTCDMYIDESKISATNKATSSYNYFVQNKEFLNRDLDMAEQYIIMMFGFVASEYIETDVSATFVPYLNNEIYRRNFLKHIDELKEERKSLLYQLDLCANGLAQFEQNDNRILELKGKTIKSVAVRNEIAQLEAANKQLADKIAPFLNTYIPQQYWLSSYLSRMRDFVKGGYVSTLQEALSMIRMEEQADHERYMDLVMSAESWRRLHRN